jgi:hypothetical protein
MRWHTHDADYVVAVARFRAFGQSPRWSGRDLGNTGGARELHSGRARSVPTSSVAIQLHAKVSIPAFTAIGLLPDGVHDCSVLELKGVLGSGYRRVQLLESLDRCIKLMHEEALCGTLYVGGSFVTDKERPDDLELTLDVREEARLVQDRALLFHDKYYIEVRRMGVDWYPTLPGRQDLTAYFQRVGEKTAADKKLAADAKKGILRLTKW